MKDTKVLYKTIYDDLRKKVITGKFKPGDRIPTEKEMAALYGVSRITSKKAMDLAAENGMITRIPGRGSFITHEAVRISKRNNQKDQKLLAVIQPDLSEFFGLDFYKEIEKLAFEDGFFLMHGLSSKDIQKEQELIRRFSAYGVDGFLVLPVHYETFSNEILRLILEKVPLVLIDRSLRDLNSPNVISCNYEAGKKGIEYLYSLGHRNIGIVSRPIEAGSSLQERKDGAADAIREKGLTLEDRHTLNTLNDLDDKKDSTYEAHKQKVRNFLKENKQITALFTLEHSPVTIIRKAAAELKIRIPEDLSVLSFDSPGHLIDRIHPVTHIQQDEKAMALRAYALLKTLMAKEEPEVSKYRIPVKLVIGETTADLCL